MSKLLQDNSSYLRLLLDTSKNQALLLLQYTTPAQANVICEIAYNLLDLPLSSSIQEKQVSKNKKTLLKLSKKTTSVKNKQKLISDNSRSLLGLLETVKESLLGLI